MLCSMIYGYKFVWCSSLEFKDPKKSKFAPSIDKAWIVTNWTLVLGHHHFWLYDLIISAVLHELTLTISTVPHEFQSSGVGLHHLLQMYAPYYSLWSRCNATVSSHPFPSSAVQHSHRDAYCQQQHNNLQHFQAPIQGTWMFSHLHITMTFCKHRAKPSMQPHLVYRALPWLYSLPPLDGQHGQEGQPCRCNVLLFQKSFSLWSLKHSSCLHWPNLHGYKLTEDK